MQSVLVFIGKQSLLAKSGIKAPQSMRKLGGTEKAWAYCGSCYGRYGARKMGISIETVHHLLC